FAFLQSLGTEIGKLSPSHATGEPDLEYLSQGGLTDSEQNVMNGFLDVFGAWKNVFIHEKWQLKPKDFAFLG
ncbi:hypothetical protein S83_046837, partial [Arachis hypogaea]